MKTSVEISKSAFGQAARLAAKEHTTVKALVEEGLRRVMAERETRKPFTLRRASFKGNELQPEMADASWRQIRDATCEGRGR